MPFLPITKEEALKRGWDELDVIFVTGDAYIDHPSFGVPLLARWLEAHGFRVGIIPQPDWRSKDAFMALGRPRLFFAVSAGAMDSMVAHYTPARKLRHDDAYTPGNRHGARPNRATIIYTSRLKEAYRDVPVVIGGIEASLRRFAHYDFWEDRVRRSILFDAKADLLVFGMGEKPLLELAERLAKGEPFREITDVRGTAFIAPSPGLRPPSPSGRGAGGEGLEMLQFIELPSYEETSSDKKKYAATYRLMAEEQNPFCAKPLIQPHGDRRLFCNPPSLPLSEKELDAVYDLAFAKAPHPSYKEPIPAWEQIRCSITTHRGCFGGCAFCAIGHHQGKFIQSRSAGSIIREIERLAKEPWFRGSVSDVGGPTANMYGLECASSHMAACRKGSCLYPKPCPHLVTDDRRLAELLRKARGVAGVRNVTVSSGVRFDLLERQPAYFAALLRYHVGGLLKVAPEHTVDRVLACMRKPGKKAFEEFLGRFRDESRRLGKRHAIVPYLISGHPGCTLDDMVELALFLRRNGLKVEQVQDFTPTPGTLATCIYYTGIDPFSGKEVHVAASDREKRLQKALLLSHVPAERRNIIAALAACGREAAGAELFGNTPARGSNVKLRKALP
ncbi:MAG TPA: YgiQ family radical SAM protein [Geobacteraceae bacterium]|nr:YgiQ family radical SAM protein [Geobacteraceae bacterium]